MIMKKHGRRFIKKIIKELFCLQKATKNSATALDAYCTLLYLQTYQGNEVEIDGFMNVLTASTDKNSYLFIMFNGAVLGRYSKKFPYQLDLINRIGKDNTFNDSIKTASYYMKAMHYVFSMVMNRQNKIGSKWTQCWSGNFI